MLFIFSKKPINYKTINRYPSFGKYVYGILDKSQTAISIHHNNDYIEIIHNDLITIKNTAVKFFLTEKYGNIFYYATGDDINDTLTLLNKRILYVSKIIEWDNSKYILDKNELTKVKNIHVLRGAIFGNTMNILGGYEQMSDLNLVKYQVKHAEIPGAYDWDYYIESSNYCSDMHFLMRHVLLQLIRHTPDVISTLSEEYPIIGHVAENLQKHLFKEGSFLEKTRLKKRLYKKVKNPDGSQFSLSKKRVKYEIDLAEKIEYSKELWFYNKYFLGQKISDFFMIYTNALASRKDNNDAVIKGIYDYLDHFQYFNDTGDSKFQGEQAKISYINSLLNKNMWHVDILNMVGN